MKKPPPPSHIQIDAVVEVARTKRTIVDGKIMECTKKGVQMRVMKQPPDCGSQNDAFGTAYTFLFGFFFCCEIKENKRNIKKRLHLQKK